MSKKEIIELLKMLDDNDCLHSEFEWYTLDEDGEIENYDVEWILEFINQNKDGLDNIYQYETDY